MFIEKLCGSTHIIKIRLYFHTSAAHHCITHPAYASISIPICIWIGRAIINNILVFNILCILYIVYRYKRYIRLWYIIIVVLDVLMLSCLIILCRNSSIIVDCIDERRNIAIGNILCIVICSTIFDYIASIGCISCHGQIYDGMRKAIANWTFIIINYGARSIYV